MKLRSLRALPLLLALLTLPLHAAVVPSTSNGNPAAATTPERIFATPPSLKSEIQALVRLLEDAHYNKEAVRTEDYREVIPNYMSDWDGQHMFFLESDREQFESAYSGGLYWNIASMGQIDPAYQIFNVYEKRVRDRVEWIFNALEKEFDLTKDEMFVVDRKDATWPATMEEADALWTQRVKFEIIQEMLADKTREEAVADVHKRYERMLKNLTEMEAIDLAELFLANVAKLYDPHSTYFSADTFEDFSIQMRAQLVGIGALLGMEEDECVVKEIITGGPADLDQRLKPNDRILAVSQVDAEPVEVIGMKLRKIVDMIRGDKGTRVRLTVRAGEASEGAERREIELTRNVVNLDSARARGAIYDVPNEEGTLRPIGVIKLPTFYGPDSSAEGAQNSATRDVATLVERMKDAGVDGIVLDLRDNGGGLLSEAIDLTGLFIEQGPVVQVRNYFGEVKVDSDLDPGIIYTGPLAVLVSRFSASASEIVAGALQNYGRAVVIGDSSTHGKGTVQTVVEMRGMRGLGLMPNQRTGAAKLTIQKFYLPSGSSTQLMGVVPDIVLPSTDDLLPVGERSLPHALVWDEIPSSAFEGQPLDEKILDPLRSASEQRQASLEEFQHLTRQIEWFRQRQDQKALSLNLEERLKMKEEDRLFKEAMDDERSRLAETNFPSRDFFIGNPPPPKVAPVPPADGEEPGEEPEPIAELDIHLREALRVLNDALELADNPQFASEGAPLTVARMSTRANSIRSDAVSNQERARATR